MTAQELGELAAHMVWESYSDFMTSEPLNRLLDALALSPVGEIADAPVARELLMYHLWLHVQALHRGFAARGDLAGADPVVEALSKAFFHDAAEAGVDPVRLPLFRGEVVLRLKEYASLDHPELEEVGKTVLGHLIPPDPPMTPALTRAAAARTLALHGAEILAPFQDFIETVVLRDG